MNIFAIPPIITFFLIAGEGFFVWFNNRRSSSNILYGLFCLSLCIWLFGFSFMYLSETKVQALWWARNGFLGIIFIPIFAYHFVLVYLNKKIDKILIFLYLSGFFTLFIFRTNLVYKNVSDNFWGYYPVAGKFYIVFLFCFLTGFCGAMVQLVLELSKLNKSDKATASFRKNQLLYLLFAFGVGTTGIVDYLIKFPQINIYPWGYISAFGLITFFALAIVKYRLMDIKLIFTRFSIFVFVYTLVLGGPFGLGFFLFGKGLWLVPVSFMAVLATAGPYLYFYIQKRTEDKFLAQQKKYQEILYKAAQGMGRIKNLKRLIKLIAHILVKTVSLKGCKIFVYEESTENFVLKEKRGETQEETTGIEKNSVLISYLMKIENPVVYEETKYRGIEEKEKKFVEIASTMEKLGCAIIVPCFAHSQLIAIISLDHKKSGDIFSKEDLIIFSFLANHVGLAIENALFYEEIGKDFAQRHQEARLRSIGELGSGVAHQLNNRFNFTTITAGMILDIIDQVNDQDISKEDLLKLINYCRKNVKKIEEDAVRGSEIASAITNYSRSSMKLSAYSLKKTISSAVTLCLIKHPKFNVEIDQDIAGSLTYWGNMSTIQDIVFNTLDNSFDALKFKLNCTKDGRLKNEKFTPLVKISAHIEANHIIIEVYDNGIGVKDEDLKNSLFVPFFTTKSSAGSQNRGTGMGLSMMKQLIEKNNGSVKIDSEYTKWTKVFFTLPKATKEQIQHMKKGVSEHE